MHLPSVLKTQNKLKQRNLLKIIIIFILVLVQYWHYLKLIPARNWYIICMFVFYKVFDAMRMIYVFVLIHTQNMLYNLFKAHYLIVL